MNNQSFLTQDISKELGLDSLPVEEQKASIQKVGDIIFQRVMIRAIEELDEDSKTELSKVMDLKKNDVEAMLTFFRSKIHNFDVLVMEEVADFKKEARDLMLAAKGK